MACLGEPPDSPPPTLFERLIDLLIDNGGCIIVFIILFLVLGSFFMLVSAFVHRIN